MRTMPCRSLLLKRAPTGRDAWPLPLNLGLVAFLFPLLLPAEHSSIPYLYETWQVLRSDSASVGSVPVRKRLVPGICRALRA